MGRPANRKSNPPALAVDSERLIGAWLSDLDVQPQTKAIYRRCITPFFRYLKQRKIKRPITREDILAYKQHLRDRRVRAHTQRGYVAAVRRICAWAAAKGLTETDIAHGIRSVPLPKSSTRDSLTRRQARILLSAIDTSTLLGKRDAALLHLLIFAGPRPVSLHRASVGDLRNVGDQQVLFLQGKARMESDEFVVLPPVLFACLQDYLRERGETQPEEPLFVSHSDRNRGSRLSVRSISRIVKERLRKAGINQSTLCAGAMRVSAVSFGLQSGATIQQVAAMVHHSSIQTTLHYAKNLQRTNPDHSAEFQIAAFLSKEEKISKGPA